jgi:hypothetical protein
LTGAAACGSSKSSDSSPAAIEATTTTTKAPPSAAAVQGAVLTLSDLPAGYSAMPDTSSGGDSSLCPAAKAQMPSSLSGDTNPSGSAQFSQSQLGPFLFEAVGVVDDAQAEFAKGKAALDACTSAPWTETDAQGQVTTYNLAPVSFPTHGSEQVAYKLTASATGAQIEGDIVVIRIDGVLMMIGGLGTTSILGNHPMDPAQLSTIVDTAVGKIEAL